MWPSTKRQAIQSWSETEEGQRRDSGTQVGHGLGQHRTEGTRSKCKGARRGRNRPKPDKRDGLETILTEED